MLVTRAAVLVTGATGLLGQALVQRLATRHAVFAVRRRPGPPGVGPAGCRWLAADLCIPGAAARLVAALRPQWVFHAAACTDVDRAEAERSQAWRLNVLATGRLAAACAAAGVRLAYVSTDYVFAGQDGPYPEAARPAPVNWYGQTKLAGEAVVRAAGGRWLIARTSQLYGPGRGFPRAVAAALRGGGTVLAATDLWGTPTLAADLADALADLAAGDCCGLFHLAGSDCVSRYQWALAVARHFPGAPGRVQPVQAADLGLRAARPARAGLISTRAPLALGRPLLGVGAGLERLYGPIPAGGMRDAGWSADQGPAGHPRRAGPPDGDPAPGR